MSVSHNNIAIIYGFDCIMHFDERYSHSSHLKYFGHLRLIIFTEMIGQTALEAIPLLLFTFLIFIITAHFRAELEFFVSALHPYIFFLSHFYLFYPTGQLIQIMCQRYPCLRTANSYLIPQFAIRNTVNDVFNKFLFFNRHVIF